MNKKGVYLLLLVPILFLLSISFVSAAEPYHLKLLAVQQVGDNFTGSDADIFLELKEGSGRVFLETSLLTKLDTQISTRFAKEIACDYFKLDCNEHDFFFTIQAKSNIVGGPSAGAAIAALTTIAVLDLPYDEQIAITGTINSGGIVGPVGGVKEKIIAAAQINLPKVLVPQGSELPDEDSDFNLEVQEVIDLDQVVFHLTGISLNNKEVVISENEMYREIMKDLQEQLCERTEKIETELIKGVILSAETKENIDQQQEKAHKAILAGNYYSAASFCFANNINLKTSYYQEKKASFADVKKLFTELKEKTDLLEQEVDQKWIKTISDLQTLLIVKERLNDVQEQIKQFEENPERNLVELYSLLGYAEERYFSAVSWKEFFSMPGKPFVINAVNLQNSCTQKISEAEERFQYANLFFGDFYITSLSEKIISAKNALNEEEFGLCLMIAAQAKADANAILSSLGLNNETMADYVNSKKQAVERIIFENSAEDIFPILGYSYYQYAQALSEEDQSMGLVYLEYALEISELGMYFPEEQTFLEKIRQKRILPKESILLGIGFVIGVITTLVVIILRKKSNNLR